MKIANFVQDIWSTVNSLQLKYYDIVHEQGVDDSIGSQKNRPTTYQTEHLIKTASEIMENKGTFFFFLSTLKKVVKHT